jgi:hypothetical protein
MNQQEEKRMVRMRGMQQGGRVAVALVAVIGLLACGGGGGNKPAAATNTTSSSPSPSSSSSSSSTGSGSSATKVDPCTLSAADVQAVVGVAVASGQPNGAQICRYFPVPNPDQIAVVEVVVSPLTTSLASIKAQEPSEYLLEDVPALGDGAFYADGTPNGYLYAVKGGTEFNVNVSSPIDPDSGETTEDTATRKAHAIALMNKLLSR